MRIYEPDQFTLQALKNTPIELALDVPNEVIPTLAGDPAAATAWVQTNVISYTPSVQFRYIVVGNEVMPTDPISQSVLPAMHNIQNALAQSPAAANVKVSTTIRVDLLVQFLAANGAPLLANVYPYFAYIGSSGQVALDYAIFGTGGRVVVHDGVLGYQNLFHAMVDSVYAALEKAGAPNLQVVVSETGWPSAGNDGATPENAAAYYLGLTNGTVTSGTPKRPGQPVETYLFAMFDENQKPGAASEQHFGLFTPDKQPKYPLVKFTN
ncbi:unnamed protein product [Linum tenue]|uniref:glucan endo-1,3-beta-D-glucosidase n=1 Tax=Linum tenue TaxID=586396 RepID=A0AAV0PVM2_9ROSI|nr:unnamed protein product [Linum tenue]